MPDGMGDALVDWDDLYRRYAADLRRLIATRLPSNASVEDVLQETFIRAYRSRHRFDPTQPEWPWLATLAHRSCVKWWRDHRPTATLFDRNVLDNDAAAPGSDEHLRRMDQSGAVLSALSLMEPRHRRLLYLREAEDFAYARLSDEEQVSYAALKSLLARARARFRSHYARFVEESAVAVASLRGVSSRLRDRLAGGGNLGTGCERVGSLVGMAVVAGVMGVLSVTGSTPPAEAGAESVAGMGVHDNAVFMGIAIDDLPTGTTGATASTTENVEWPGRRSTSREPDTAAGGGILPVAIRTSGGLTHGPDAEMATLSLDVDAPVVGRTTVVRQEVRCNAGKVYTAECAAIRAVPAPSD